MGVYKRRVCTVSCCQAGFHCHFTGCGTFDQKSHGGFAARPGTAIFSRSFDRLSLQRLLQAFASRQWPRISLACPTRTRCEQIAVVCNSLCLCVYAKNSAQPLARGRSQTLLVRCKEIIALCMHSFPKLLDSLPAAFRWTFCWSLAQRACTTRSEFSHGVCLAALLQDCSFSGADLPQIFDLDFTPMFEKPQAPSRSVSLHAKLLASMQ